MKQFLAVGLVTVAGIAVLGTTGCQPKPKGVSAVPAVTRPVGTGGREPLKPVTPTPGPGPGERVPGDTKPIVSNPPPPQPGVDTPPPTNPSGIDLPLDPDTGYVRDENIFKAYTVYFDFDKSAVKSSERTKVEAVADHLKGNATHKLKVEGHCDERGTEGYNLALGERRALAVREYLVRLGIGADRVYTISFGEAIPAAQGHDEAAWSQNRRGEFILLTPP